MILTTEAELIILVARAGWMCCDTASFEPGEQRSCLKGNFWEQSNSANSYRAEQLGVCAINHLIAALTSFCKIENCATKIWCDNMGAVSISRKRKRRVRPSASCANILRNIRNTRNKTKATIKYNHVDDHIDKYLLLTQMTYVCDKEANKAAERSIEQKFLVEEKQLLPREVAAAFVGGKKLTSDLSRAKRLEASREKAK